MDHVGDGLTAIDRKLLILSAAGLALRRDLFLEQFEPECAIGLLAEREIATVPSVAS